MPTNKQRRDAQRRHLERQLQRRREREVRRRKTNLILSIAGTLVLIAAIVVTIVLVGGSDKKTPSAKTLPSSGATTPTSPTTPPTSPAPSTSYAPAKGKTVTFGKVTVKGATDLTGYPVVSSTSTTAPKKLAVKDLVVGKGAAAKAGDTVTVQYVGVLYSNGSKFDSSWDHGAPATFALKSGPGGVIDGFNQGIGGTKGVAPMKIGGRRIIVMPSSLAYGSSGNGSVPPNAALVFVVDLKKIGS